MSDTRLEKKANESMEQTRQASRPERIYMPRVDIREAEEAFELLADMPGVDKQGVAIGFERGVLTIEGNGDVETPAGFELADSEFGVGQYRRDFTLSDAIDAERISARMTNGVLYVWLPKRESVKSRKIEITD